MVGSGLEGFSIELFSRFGTGELFVKRALALIDSTGLAKIAAAGAEFQVRIIGDPTGEVTLSDMIIDFDTADKISLKGALEHA